LLGIASLNNSRNVTLPGGDDARAAAFTQGITTVQAVFKTSKTNPVVAGALASYFLRMDNFPAVRRSFLTIFQPVLIMSTMRQAIKLSERMIQYADSKIMTSEGHLFLARALQGQGDMDSNVEYGKSMEYNPEQLLAMLGLVQSLASSACA
jgi:RNA polymerase-associated protein CTR9